MLWVLHVAPARDLAKVVHHIVSRSRTSTAGRRQAAQSGALGWLAGPCRARPGRAGQGRAGQGRAGQGSRAGQGIPAKPLCMHAANTWSGSLGCHLRRHTPPPVLICKVATSTISTLDSMLTRYKPSMHQLQAICGPESVATPNFGAAKEPTSPFRSAKGAAGATQMQQRECRMCLFCLCVLCLLLLSSESVLLIALLASMTLARRVAKGCKQVTNKLQLTSAKGHWNFLLSHSLMCSS